MDKTLSPLKPLFIAGPCVIESAEVLDVVASELVRLERKYDIEVVKLS